MSDKQVSHGTSSLSEELSNLNIACPDAGESDSSDGSEGSVDVFDHAQCLFCNCHSEDLDDNLDHMRKRHGMIIPYPESLIVDVEILVKYLHLVIYEYTECLFCGSIRNTSQAAQQHMTGKGHCKIDVEKETSEFKDFYDFESSADADGGRFGDSGPAHFVDVEDETRRLPSGKTVSHRKAKKVRDHRDSKSGEENKSFSHLEQGKHSQDLSDTTTLVTLSGKDRDLVEDEKSNDLFNKQLASMRQGDRLALAHLPVPQQRTLIAKAKKQQEMWNRFENDQAIKLQCKAKAK
ncbi:C2H2 finger domain containing protein [Colletotrichum kahawae]|uniref:C2H2 finger domain containing protein n=1 Tax=Colletotrichum kahawae TaxID=34407 RepID=A0AAE0D7G3_COLKA|nr:C2H2 finger domain containing protein [Colletotrichum kahawae]